jgi:hypothetical protein
MLGQMSAGDLTKPITCQRTYLSFMKQNWRLVRHVVSGPPSLVDLVHPREDSLEFFFEHWYHSPSNEAMNRLGVEDVLILWQRILSLHLDLAILYYQVNAIYQVVLFR